MAIPAIPQSLYVQQGNRQVFLQWDLQSGATSYSVQRSIDGVSYIGVATPSVNQYLDTTVLVGVQYFYQVASTNTDGTSAYTVPQSVIPSPTAELSLQELRYRSQQRADRVNSQFVTLPEWNFFVNQSMDELYDLLITVYEDYFMAPRAKFQSVGNQFIYPLPDGLIVMQNQSGNNFVPQPFYKLLGVDFGLNTNQNAYVTMRKYNLIDRNQFYYPTQGNTVYSVYNPRYRVLANNIEFIPTPSPGQPIQLLYIPRLPQLLQETDLTTIGFSGWLQYVIVRTAKYALDKEESDTSKLDQELIFLKARIEESAMNRDAGQADTISDTRNANGWGGNNGWGGFGRGGW